VIAFLHIAGTVVVQIRLNTVFIQMQDSSLNVAFKCLRLSRNSEADRAKPDCSELDHAEPNQGLHLEIIMCKQKREQSMTRGN